MTNQTSTLVSKECLVKPDQPYTILESKDDYYLTEREFFKRIGNIAGIPVQNQQDWKLVRHSSPNNWHPATDQLRGTQAYG